MINPGTRRVTAGSRATDEGTKYTDVVIGVDATSGAITVTGATSVAYRLRVKSFQAPTSVTGADTWSYDATHQMSTVDKQGAAFGVTIAGLNGNL
jgi:hypothetical protein